MRLTASWIRLLLQLSTWELALAASPPLLRPRDYQSKEYYALQLQPSARPEEIAEHLGLQFEGQIGQLNDHYLFSGPKTDEDVVHEFRRRRKRDSSGVDANDLIIFSEKQKPKKLEKRTVIPPPPPHLKEKRQFWGGMRSDQNLLQGMMDVAQKLDIHDPIFLEQWHLMNTVDKGHDVNVTGLWLEGITGHNATVAIVDDGLDMYSQDLKDNYFAEGSYDFNDHVAEPRPRLSDDRHGTRCAGEIAAVRNDVCGVGVAYDAKVAGIRILSKQISDADEAIALNYAYQQNQIYSCSWGPPDDGRSMEAPGILIKKAILKGINEGRDGKGSIFVFASGNGAASGDNCNFDGYTNSIYSITVGAIDRKGQHPYYSEHCSAQMVVTYSSGSGDAIHTTDVGTNQCYSGHGGTSAAAPLAAGIFALVLSVRPELTWRDMQYLAKDTAVVFNEDDGLWEKTASGQLFSHRYGFGKLDAYAIVQAAKEFKQVKPQAWYKSPVLSVNHEIPQGAGGLKSEFKVTKEMLQKANLERIEHVQVHMNAKHGRRGDMSVDLISPEGIISHIATRRDQDSSTAGYKDWNFMSVKHWGESGVGTWSVIVRDTRENQYNGTLVDWSLILWGEAINAEVAELHPLPGEEGQQKAKPRPTTTADAATTMLPSTHPADHSEATGNPADHPNRPVNSKPTSDSNKTNEGWFFSAPTRVLVSFVIACHFACYFV
ncbi:peptidase S8/S53 domain-containing protein [Pyronema omphalodes]|nr:peptidase S8/S53 domain-containing protein [Pyronema omphalodes]